MRILQKTEYGLKAVLDLAAQPSGSLVKVVSIAERQDIPLKFLELLLGNLRDGGLVESRRGARGGYRLTRPPESITVGQVVALLGDPVDRTRGKDDAFTEFWDRVDASVSELLSSTTFAMLLKHSNAHHGTLQQDSTNLVDAVTGI
jgi:Rrf2 family transcriptional regulator, cysteine metabolism repressor